MSEEVPQVMGWIKSTLENCGIHEYENPVPDMGLEYIERYLNSLIVDITMYSYHATEDEAAQIKDRDVKMAIEMRDKDNIKTSQELMKGIIDACNVGKLPMNFSASLELPKQQDDTFTLLQKNFKVRGVCS